MTECDTGDDDETNILPTPRTYETDSRGQSQDGRPHTATCFAISPRCHVSTGSEGKVGRR